MIVPNLLRSFTDCNVLVVSVEIVFVLLSLHFVLHVHVDCHYELQQ